MEHAEIEARGFIDNYLAGSLGEAESEQFEEHYLHCRSCTEQLELGAALRDGLKRAAAEDAARLRPLPVLAWLVRLSRSRQSAALAAALLVALLVPSTLSRRKLIRLTEERDQARTALATQGGAPSPELRRELEQARRAAAEAVWREAEAVAREREAREAAQQRLAQALAPQANTPILTLGAVRGAGAPADRVRLASASGWLVLALELDSAAEPRYRVRLARAEQPARVVWSGDAFVPDASGTLAASLPATLLPPGDYVVSVEGLPAAAKPVPAGSFSFRVLAR